MQTTFYKKKRLAKILESKDIYDSYLKKEDKPLSIAEERVNSNQAVVSAQSSNEGSGTITLPPSCNFTPEAEADYNDGGYSDILNLMERLENETKNEDDNDSGNFFIISFSSSNNQFHKSLISISPIYGVAKCFFLFNIVSYIGIFGPILILI